MRIKTKPDTRFVYSAHGTWFGSISEVAATDTGLPCCPHCGSVLFEMDTEEAWWRGARAYEADGHPGYVAMLEWSRGRCFPTMAALQQAYAEMQQS